MLAPASNPPRCLLVRREARLVAAAIDCLVILSLGAVCLVAGALAMLLQVDPFERDPTAGEWSVGYAIGLLWIPLSSLYVGLGGRTVGARMLGLREPGGGARTFAIRGLLWWPSALLLAVGMWWPWVDPHGRSLPDILSGSTLIETEPLWRIH